MTQSLPGRPKVYRRRRGLRGFTLVELMVVIVIAGVLATIAFNRLMFYSERAEKSAMDATLAATKLGLQIRLAELIVTNRQMAAAQLERENPMHWLEEPPADYLGDYREPAKPGSWYFAADAAQIVYVPNNTSYLQGLEDDKKELRFRVGLRYDEIELGGVKVKSLTGVGLVPVKPYRWF